MRFSFFVSWCAALLFGIFYTMPHEVAYAVSTSSTSIPKELAELVLKKAGDLGYSGDSLTTIVEATERAMTTVADAGSAVAGGSWLGVGLKIAGPLGLLLEPTSLGDDSMNGWAVKSDGTVSISPVAAPSSSTGIAQGSNFFSIGYGTGEVDCASPYACVVAILTLEVGAQTDKSFDVYGCYTTGNTNGYGGGCYYDWFEPGKAVYSSVMQVDGRAGYAGPVCAGTGVYYTVDATCNPAPAPVATGISLSDALASIPARANSIPLNPAVLAAILNALWEQASQQQGYQGIPYPSTNPVSSSDASAVQQADPSSWPSVGGAASPATAPSGSGDPFAIAPSTGTGTGTGTGTSTGTDGTPDLCQLDPAAAACQVLGSAPTAPDLPSSDASVSLSPVSVGGPSNPVCPLPVSVDVLGMSLSFSYQSECDFMTRVRPFVVAMCGVIAAGIFVAGLKS